MLNFNSLTIVKNDTIIVSKVYKKDPRYVIGVDPFDIKEDSFNIFKVYDKLNMSYCTRIKTKKTFDKVVENLLHSYKSYEVIVSQKFININGQPVQYAITNK